VYEEVGTCTCTSQSNVTGFVCVPFTCHWRSGQLIDCFQAPTKPSSFLCRLSCFVVNDKSLRCSEQKASNSRIKDSVFGFRSDRAASVSKRHFRASATIPNAHSLFPLVAQSNVSVNLDSSIHSTSPLLSSPVRKTNKTNHFQFISLHFILLY